VAVPTTAHDTVNGTLGPMQGPRSITTENAAPSTRVRCTEVLVEGGKVPRELGAAGTTVTRGVSETDVDASTLTRTVAGADWAPNTE